MYTAHRGIPQPNNRLNELFDQLRGEFENQGRASEQFETTITGQVQEMEMIRNKVYQLEQSQIKMKHEYENEIRLLREQLEARGGPSMSSHMGAPTQPGGHPQPPPALGHGPSNLFSGIMANQGQGGPGLAPPPEQQPTPQQHPLAPGGPGQPQGPPQGPQPASFSGYHPGPTLNGYAPPPPQQQTSSPAMGQNRLNRGPPGGPATPQQNQHMPYPNPRASPQIPQPTPAGPPGGHMTSYRVGNELATLNFSDLPHDYKKEGQDWHAVFNPEIPRVLDVNLIHNLTHESVVCCVRFSHDGKYVATGCNRSAQIFDVQSGQEVCRLQDETVDKEGDLYIRSVCFSPDGRLLATGAEDKLIRVSPMLRMSSEEIRILTDSGLGHCSEEDPEHLCRS